MAEAGRLEWVFKAIDKVSPVIRNIQRTIQSVRGKTVRYDYWLFVRPSVKLPNFGKLQAELDYVNQELARMIENEQVGSDAYNNMLERQRQLLKHMNRVARGFASEAVTVEDVTDKLNEFAGAINWNAKEFLRATRLAFIPHRDALLTLEGAYATVESQLKKTYGQIAEFQAALDIARMEKDANAVKYYRDQLRSAKSAAFELRRELYFLRYVMKYLRSAGLRELPFGRPRIWFAFYNILGRVTGVLGRFQKAMGSAAWIVTWAGLAMLGTFWSLQMFLTETWTPLERYIQGLSNFADAAFEVATWLGMAAATGQDWAQGIDISQAVNNVVDSGMRLQATWGNIQAMMLYTLASIFSEYPGALQALENAFGSIFQFILDNKDVIAEFLIGFGQGIQEALPFIQNLINTVRESGISFQGLGKIVGKVFIAFMALGPVIVGLQAMFQVFGGVITLVRTVIGAKSGLIDAIKKSVVVFQTLRTVMYLVWTAARANPWVAIISILILVVIWIYKVTDGFRNWGGIIEALKRYIQGFIQWIQRMISGLQTVANTVGGIFRFAGAVGGGLWNLFTGGSAEPKNVTIYQNVSVGTIRETADVDEVMRRMSVRSYESLWGGI